MATITKHDSKKERKGNDGIKCWKKKKKKKKKKKMLVADES